MEKNQQTSLVEKKRTAQRCVIVGAYGQLAKFITPHIPAIEIKRFDLKQIQCSENYLIERLARNVVRANILADKDLPSGENGLSQVIVLSVPESVITSHRIAPFGNRAKLFNLLGVSGAGFSETLVIYCNSVHENAASVLDSFSGPVIGVHFMFRPDPTLRMSDQSAVVTVTNKKAFHHLYPRSIELVFSVLRSMGIGKVVQMSPVEHDLLMVDLQFASHSVFILLADMFARLPFLPHNELLEQAFNTSSRILKGQPHVYCGIAKNNPANEIFLSEWSRRVRVIPKNDVLTTTIAAIETTEQVANAIASGGAIKNRNTVSTPISRARSAIIAAAARHRGAVVGPPVGLTPSLDRYLNALTSEASYENFFGALALELAAVKPA